MIDLMSIKFWQEVFLIGMLFFVTHSFYFLSHFNSSLFVPLFLLFFVAPFVSVRSGDVVRLVGRKAVLNGLVIAFAGVASLFPSVLHVSGDYSYGVNFISHLAQYIIILFFLLFFLTTGTLKSDGVAAVQRAIVCVFAIQSVIQLLGFLFPSVAKLVHVFYAPGVVEHLYENYKGGRGLALTGAPGWGLSVGYGLAFLIYVKEYLIESRKYSWNTFFIAFLLVVGMLFSGRSAFLGVILGFVYYLFNLNQERVSFFVKSCFLAVCILFSGYLLLPNMASKVEGVVLPFVFEAYLNYTNTGVFQTGSTNKLIEMWRVPISSGEVLLGTGHMVSETGGYYKETDVGYIRNLLYGGVGWLVILYLYFLYVAGFLNSWLARDRDSAFYLFVFIYIFILEAKAMTVGYNKYLFTMLMLLYMSKIYVVNSKEREEG